MENRDYHDFPWEPSWKIVIITILHEGFTGRFLQYWISDRRYEHTYPTKSTMAVSMVISDLDESSAIIVKIQIFTKFLKNHNV